MQPPGAGKRLLSLEGICVRRELTLTGVKQSCTSQSETKQDKPLTDSASEISVRVGSDKPTKVSEDDLGHK